jgi:predicted nucleic acid-binding protein
VSNANRSYLLDTSALLALLEDEPGASRVAQVLKSDETFISALSLMEVRYITLQERNQSEADVRHALLKRSGATLLWDLDEPTILRAASYKAKFAVSFADALIAASAHRQGATLLHKDPEFDALADQVRQERLPAKPARKST